MTTDGPVMEAIGMGTWDQIWAKRTNHNSGDSQGCVKALGETLNQHLHHEISNKQIEKGEASS